MLRLKYWIKDFFGFSRSQVNGFVVLLLLTIVVLFSEPCWQWWISKQPTGEAADKALLDSIVRLWTVKIDSSQGSNYHESRNLYRFNPNTISSDSMITLGFPVSVVQKITRYRIKGGEFRIKSDLQKIYGMDSTFYREIYAFIDLPEKKALKENTSNGSGRKDRQQKERVFRHTIEKFDLNTADTAQLKRIYGIGDKLALRIIKFRNALGGFISMNQLHEVYGLDSTVINRLTKASEIKPDFIPTRFNINVVVEKDLATHPYLSKVAKVIVSYRFQHGAFKAVSEIRNIGSMDENTIQKIIPYLEVHDEL